MDQKRGTAECLILLAPPLSHPRCPDDGRPAYPTVHFIPSIRQLQGIVPSKHPHFRVRRQTIHAQHIRRSSSSRAKNDEI